MSRQRSDCVKIPRSSSVSDGYFVHPLRRVQDFADAGQVFLTLWSEPIGETTDVASVLPLAKGSKGKYGERIHSKVRRFVVVREGTQSCSAV